MKCQIAEIEILSKKVSIFRSWSIPFLLLLCVYFNLKKKKTTATAKKTKTKKNNKRRPRRVVEHAKIEATTAAPASTPHYYLATIFIYILSKTENPSVRQ